MSVRAATMLLLAFAMLGVSSRAGAAQEQISITQAPDRRIVVTLSGFAHPCDIIPAFTAMPGLSVTGNNVTLESVVALNLLGCPVPPPTTGTTPYSVPVNLGTLADGAYNLAWNLRLSAGPLVRSLEASFDIVGGILIGPIMFPNDQIVVRPPSPTSQQSFQIDVPAYGCFMSNPVPILATSSIQVTGNTIAIAITQPGWACFSAGDPNVPKPVTFNVGPLPPGVYQITYSHSQPGSISLNRSASVTVLGAAAIPTMSQWGTALLVLLLMGSAFLARRRLGLER